MKILNKSMLITTTVLWVTVVVLAILGKYALVSNNQLIQILGVAAIVISMIMPLIFILYDKDDKGNNNFNTTH